jgi:hypothetical protein
VRGTTFVFRISERAQVTIAISRHVAGLLSGRRCVKPKRGLKAHCLRTVTVVTLHRNNVRAGAGRIAFSGRVGRTTLAPGAYFAQLAARDPAGNRSKSVTLRFTVVADRR